MDTSAVSAVQLECERGPSCVNVPVWCFTPRLCGQFLSSFIILVVASESMGPQWFPHHWFLFLELCVSAISSVIKYQKLLHQYFQIKSTFTSMKGIEENKPELSLVPSDWALLCRINSRQGLCSKDKQQNYFPTAHNILNLCLSCPMHPFYAVLPVSHLSPLVMHCTYVVHHILAPNCVPGLQL